MTDTLEPPIKQTDRQLIVTQLLNQKSYQPVQILGSAFAPSNIALCKYWGKSNTELNIPQTSSLSISLKNKGTQTKIRVNQQQSDRIIYNGELQDSESLLSKRMVTYLDLFRFSGFQKPVYYDIDTQNNIPLSAGLASSASGFAALAMALDDLYGWDLDKKSLSILARLGSGSASRSIYNGFVLWQKGESNDGLDSYAMPINTQWLELRVGLLVLETTPKKINSRLAMQQTVETSSFYAQWPEKVNKDLALTKQAISTKDFDLLGKVSESNALAMHATMQTSWPPILYDTLETTEIKQKIWALREKGLSVYFTQDAGPNIKLLFLDQDVDAVISAFPSVEVVEPF